MASYRLHKTASAPSRARCSGGIPSLIQSRLDDADAMLDELPSRALLKVANSLSDPRIKRSVFRACVVFPFNEMSYQRLQAPGLF